MPKHILFTNGILSARYDSTINTTIPAEAIEVSDKLFFQTINETDGDWTLIDNDIIKLPFPPPTESELAAIAKQAKIEALNRLTVTTSKGNVFDGNESARINMLSAIESATFLNQTQAGWKLADNSVVMVDVAEIKEALALSIKRVGEIVTA